MDDRFIKHDYFHDVRLVIVRITFSKVGSTLYFKICSENNLSNIYFSVPDCTVSNDDDSMTYNIIDFE